MPVKKQKTKYKPKRKKHFTGTSRQETGRQSEENVVAAENVVSPVKLSKSEEKLKQNCPLTEIKTNEVLTKSKTIKLELSHTIQTTTAIATKFFVYSAVCSSCKSKRRKLELWQDNHKCTPCTRRISHR